MDFDLAYAAYNGALPHDLRMARYYGSQDDYEMAMRDGMHAAQEKRCQEIRQSVAAWRCAPYQPVLRETMLRQLSTALHQARHVARRLFERCQVMRFEKAADVMR